MGCDIHLYIEYQPKDKTQRYTPNQWHSFGGRLNPGRDYQLFGKLAGVREEGALFEAKGYPDDAGHSARDDNHLFIVEGEEERGDNTCTRAKAEEWLIAGNSKFFEKHWVTHPDWHTHSWLTDYEFEAVIKSVKGVGVEWWAILAAMNALEKGGNEARVVFWFDN